MKNIHYDGLGEMYCALEAWEESQQNDNNDTMERLRRNLRYARNNELTPLQKELLRLYFDEGKSMRQIAREQGVTPAAVSRAIDRAQKRLRRYLHYGF